MLAIVQCSIVSVTANSQVPSTSRAFVWLLSVPLAWLLSALFPCSDLAGGCLCSLWELNVCLQEKVKHCLFSFLLKTVWLLRFHFMLLKGSCTFRIFGKNWYFGPTPRPTPPQGRLEHSKLKQNQFSFYILSYFKHSTFSRKFQKQCFAIFMDNSEVIYVLGILG